MRAIIIDNKDAKALVDKLQLVALRKDHPHFHFDDAEIRIEKIHGLFHYEIVKWLQEQGANLT